MAFIDYFKKNDSDTEINKITAAQVLETKPEVREEDIRFILTKEQVTELNALFAGAIVKSGADLLDKLRRSQQVRLNDGIDITLTTDELWQLKQQAQGMRRDYQEYAKEQLEDALSLYLNGCTRIR